MGEERVPPRLARRAQRAPERGKEGLVYGALLAPYPELSLHLKQLYCAPIVPLLGRTLLACVWPWMLGVVYIRASSCCQSALSLQVRYHAQANYGVDGLRGSACLDLAWFSAPCTTKQPRMLWRGSALLLRRVWRLGYTSPRSRCMQLEY
jgi:hypothetical protein